MYKKPETLELANEETRVKTTLLEYGWQYGYSKEQKEKKDAKKSNKKTPSAEGDRPKSESMDSIEDEYIIEQKHINSLMSNMAAMQGKEGSLSSSLVGSIVGLQSEEISQMASEYAEKQAELQEGSERNERTSGVQAHKRMLASLEKQIANQEKKLAQVEERHAELQQACNDAKEVLAQEEEYGQKIKEGMQTLTELEEGENASIYQKLRYLVAMNENLKKQEHQFKAQCKEELEKLKNNIKNLKEGGGEENEDEERAKVIEQQYEADKQKLQKIRLALAKKNREIAVLQRKIDEVPSRAELSQYQRRFVELYNQVAATHKETKQFYTFYNTLDDTKLYLEKEVTLLNSIHDNFNKAMSSPATKTQFLQQFEQIVNGVLNNKSKVEERKSNEKKKRDELNEQYLGLVEKQRQYFKTVKEFQEECRKNEILLSKLKGHQG